MGDSDWDGMFRVLSNEHRRRILVALLEHNPEDDPLAVPEEIHNGERELENLQTKLYHVHLPDLQDGDFIRWDRENHEIQKGPRFGKIRPILECIQEYEQEACECRG